MIRPITIRMKKQATWYSKKYARGDSWAFDDLMQECYLSFCECEPKFDETRGLQFEGFAINCMKNHLINYLKKDHNRYNRNLELVSEYGVEENPVTNVQLDEFPFSEVLSDQVSIDIMVARFNYGLSLREIEKEMNVPMNKIAIIIENVMDTIQDSRWKK